MIALRNPEINCISSLADDINRKELICSVGQITKLIGLNFESHGPNVSIGDVVSIQSKTDSDSENLAEVVGFRENRVLLVPLDHIRGVRNGDCVFPG